MRNNDKIKSKDKLYLEPQKLNSFKNLKVHWGNWTRDTHQDLINPGWAFLGGECLVIMAETLDEPKVHY